MQLARVIGTVVATMKAPNMEGVRLLIVQPLTRRLEPVGQPVVAADALETAGPGELVYIVGAREAAEAMPNRFVPVDHAIVGIVDAVEELAGGAAGSRAAADEARAGGGHRGVHGQVADLRGADAAARGPAGARRGEAGGYLIAVDTVGAGAGETVLVLDEGTSARQIVGETDGGPLRTVIVGIVDAVEGPAATPTSGDRAASHEPAEGDAALVPWSCDLPPEAPLSGSTDRRRGRSLRA